MYHGDIRLGDTLDIKFTTRQISGAPSTLGGTPVVSAYVGNSTTQLTAGITLTVDFDAVTGLNNVRVVATSGNGYATASNYQLVITTGTVNSVSVVGEVIGSFSIEARSALMPTTAARTLDVSAGGEAGVDWANVGSPTTTLALTGTTIATTQKVDVETIKTNPVVNAGTVTFPTTATLASTTNITAGTITTTTNLTNLPSIPANWITAAGITAAALNGKGDWNVGKTGYSLTATTGLGNQTSNITGNLSGSVGSVTGAVGSVTGAVGSVTGLTAANLDVAVSTRLATASYTAPLDAAGTRTAVGLASANLDTQLGDLPTAAENATAVLTTAMTESYRADGATGTLAQMQYEIIGHLGESSIVSTTKTIKKIDGTTTAATFTLDSDTAPTSITRAT